jgi:acetyl esterase/lipase
VFRRLSLCCLLIAALVTAGFAQQRNDRAPVSGADQIKRWLQMDNNGDERLAKDETTGLMNRFFDRNDTNKDGFLDRKELESLQRRLSGNRGRQQQNANRNRQQGMSTEQLLKTAPEDVVIEADIAYRPGDSKAWRLDLVRPKEDSDRARAGIVFVHGGGWRNGDKRTGTFLRGAIEYAQKGYVCITVNYRLTGETPFPACVEDVKCAVRWLRAHAKEYNVDPDRLGGYGNSAGAHLVAMLGLCKPEAKLEGDGPYQDQSSLLQAVCASATPSDLGLFPRSPQGDSRFKGEAEERTAMIRSCSPVTHVSKDAPPFLLIHGAADRTVNVKHGDVLAEALKSAGDDVTYIRIDGAGHGVYNQHADRTKPAMEEFFARTLGNR